MCGRYLNRRQKQEIATRLKAKKVFEDPYLPNFNIAPTTFQPIVRQERDSDEREMVLARWGLAAVLRKVSGRLQGFLHVQRESRDHPYFCDVAWPLQEPTMHCPC